MALSPMQETLRLRQLHQDSERQANESLAKHHQAAHYIDERVRSAWSWLPQVERLTLGSTTQTGGSPPMWAWLQYLGTNHFIADFVTEGWHQHIDAQPLQVLLLTFQTCSLLRTLSPALWSIQSVIPNTDGIYGAAIPNDAASGLDYTRMDSNSPWGITAGGTPYFDTEGASEGEGYPLFLDNTNLPYLLKP